MATSAYLLNRKKFGRPQAIIWSNNYGTLENGLTVPEGTEGEDFIILSDHNRTEITFTKQRIESKRRLVNGNMRSYHIADKVVFDVAWEMLPSRSYNLDINFSNNGQRPNVEGLQEFTADGGAGGVDLVKWYEDNPGSFYMFLAYDRFDKFNNSSYANLDKYSEIVEVSFAAFDYAVIKRGSINTYDFFNINVSLEEV